MNFVTACAVRWARSASARRIAVWTVTFPPANGQTAANASCGASGVAEPGTQITGTPSEPAMPATPQAALPERL